MHELKKKYHWKKIVREKTKIYVKTQFTLLQLSNHIFSWIYETQSHLDHNADDLKCFNNKMYVCLYLQRYLKV